MKKNKFYQEIVIALLFILLLLLLINPWSFWMPDMMAMMIVAGILLLFAVYVSFVWRERAQDEREFTHNVLAGKYAFLAGAAVLVLGIAVESWQHNLSFWLPLTLVIMVLTKIAVLLYTQLHK